MPFNCLRKALTMLGDRDMSIDIKKYIERPTDVYHLVDEIFLSTFNETQGAFMLMKYYNEYETYCKHFGIKIQSIDHFLKSANRKRIKLIQICCPYCGKISIKVTEEKCSEIKKHQYCTACGKRSTAENVFFQLSSLIRLQAVHEAGLKMLTAGYEQEEIKIIEYDIRHMELVELTCIFETTMRDFYQEMLFLTNGFESDYIRSLIRKDTKNDFMNIDKANDHFKKAIGIGIKDKIDEDCRKKLIDMVNIRNVFVHNNGIIDDVFRKSDTYQRISDKIEGNLIFITEKDISEYLKSVLKVIGLIEEEIHSIFSKRMPKIIANYYFNE